MRIYCDSSLKEACIAFYLGHKLVVNRLPYGEEVTVNVGEYKAVIKALNIVQSRNWEVVELYTDSLLIVNQVSGSWKCRKAHLLPFRDKTRELIRGLAKKGTTVQLKWVSRDYNIAGFLLP